MSKRKHSEVGQGPEIRAVEKNSLDSDEEEEEPDSSRYRLDDEDIEGQEDGGVTLEEGVQFTPFNMKEELEEGHFDTDGMYHWKKEREIKDNWLENINWVKIKEVDPNKKTEPDSDEEMPEAVDTIALYKKILTFLQPKESISKALKRLGGDRSLSASERLKMKKAGITIPKPTNEDTKNVTILTELANKILTYLGNMDIYQETYEHINDLVSASSSKAKEPELDMYADDFGDKEKVRFNDGNPPKVEEKKEDKKEEKEDGGTMWEFKWDMDSSEIVGPHTTQQMEKWAQVGHFGEKGVFVRRCGSSQFYNSNRIDFEIYL